MKKDTNRFDVRQKNSRVNNPGVLNGWRRIRTFEGIASRFTVCPLWPLGNPSVNVYYYIQSEMALQVLFFFLHIFFENFEHITGEALLRKNVVFLSKW